MRCYGCMEEIPDNAAACPFCGYSNADISDNPQFLSAGKILVGTYEIGRTLGAGGFGVTYIGWDKKLSRKVAVKEYFPSNLATRIPGQDTVTAFSGEKGRSFLHGLERFKEEALLLMQFTGCDGIVSVYDLIEANSTAYMVMEYVQGITLKNSIDKYGKLDEETLKNYVIPMLLSLKFVHNAGYAHRDISPDNIICMPDGTVKLIDFGAARYSVREETHTLSVIVKQGYTPIEQYQKHGTQGPWTDIYAIGATMYYALTGITPDESLNRLANDTLKTPSEMGIDISKPTENAIMTALNVHPEDRPQDIDTFFTILIGENAGGRVIRKKSKMPMIAGIAAAVTLCIGTAGIVFGMLSGSTEPLPDDRVDVPNVISQTVDDAETILSEKQLIMKINDGEYFDAELIAQYVDEGYIEAGRVMAQDPTYGTPVEVESIVGVGVSKGKKQIFVPAVIDMIEETAIHQIHLMGFDDNFHVIIKEEPSDENMAGTVISQSLEEDSSVDFDGTLTLTISSGRKTPSSGDAATESIITLDDYTNKDFDKIKTELLKSGVYLIKSAAVYSNEYEYGTIIDQCPSKGSEIKSGGVVYAVVSLGVEKTRVPDVRYKTLVEAEQMLANAGLSWEIEYVVDPIVEIGHVVAEEFDGIDCSIPTKVNFGVTITLKVSADSAASERHIDEEILLAQKTVEIYVGETVAVQYSYEGNDKIIWASSSDRIAVVNEKGEITALEFGTATISAVVNGNVTFCTVYVKDDSFITLSKEYILEVDEVVSLFAEIPLDIQNDVIWRSSASEIASVENGEITALNPGYATITASYKKQTVSCGIVVDKKKILISRSDLDNNLEASAIEVLEKYGITPEIKKQYDNSCEKGRVADVGYTSGSSDSSKYIFYDDTKVTLYISLGQKSIKSVEISKYPDKMTYIYGETADYTGLELLITYIDDSTDTIKRDIPSSTILTQMPEQNLGIVYSGFTVLFAVEVKPIEVTKVSLNKNSVTLEVGQTVTLIETISPSDANDKNVTWSSSDSNIASVSGGTITAKNVGTVKMTAASSNGKKAECSVVVKEATPSSVSITPSLSLYVGGTQTLTATVLPNYAADKSVTWSSDNNSVVTVDNNGKVTAVGKGNAKITVVTNVNSRTAVCNVTVSAILPTSITLSSDELALNRNESKTLTATVLPLNAEDKSVTWTSSNIKVATIDSSGKITAQADGTTTITAATSNGKAASCTVKVSTAVEKISIIDSLTLKPNETKTLAPTFTPENSTDKTVTWKSSNTSVATVNNGQVTAIKAGTADISATTSNGKTAICKVTISGDALLSIKTMPNQTVYYIGDSIQSKGLVLSYTDIYGQTSEIKSGFDISGSTTKAGTSKVTVKYKTSSVEYEITVKEPSISVTKVQTLYGIIVEATTDPEDCPVTWSSSNKEIFYIEDGKVIPVSEGYAYAYAYMTYNGVQYSDGCLITVARVEEYEFYIELIDKDTCRNVFNISTDIPGVSTRNVNWSVDAECELGDYFYVWCDSTFTVTASYTYNGKTYSDSYTVEVMEYTLVISRLSYVTDDGEYLYSGYSVASDIPDLLVSWSISDATYDTETYTNPRCFAVYDSSMDPGDSYTVYDRIHIRVKR